MRTKIQFTKTLPAETLNPKVASATNPRTTSGSSASPRRPRTLLVAIAATVATLLTVPASVNARPLEEDNPAADGRTGAAESDETVITMRDIALIRADVRAELSGVYSDILRHTEDIAAFDDRLIFTGPLSGRAQAEYRSLVQLRNVNERRFQTLEAELASIDTALQDVSPWAEYGIDFAVFPLNEVDEFVNSWGNARSGGRSHKGTDILAPYGTEVFAIEDGFIDRSSNSALGGLSIYLVGDSGARYYYAHLSELAGFGDGERVHAGDVIGYNGDSGNARGTPHVHFQWAPDGETWRNPYPLLLAIWEFERGGEGPPVRGRG